MDQLVKQSEVARLCGCSEKTITRMIKAGRIPEPARVSPRIFGWPEPVLRAWLASRSQSAE